MSSTKFSNEDYLKAEIINLTKKLEKEKKKSKCAPTCRYCGRMLTMDKTGSTHCLECNDL